VGNRYSEVMQTATRNGARARAINGDRDRAKSGLKLVFAFICGSISLRKVSRPVLLVAPIGTTRFLEGPVKSSVWSLVGPSRRSASSSERLKRRFPSTGHHHPTRSPSLSGRHSHLDRRCRFRIRWGQKVQLGDREWPTTSYWKRRPRG